MTLRYTPNENYFEISGNDGNVLYRGQGNPDVWISKNGLGSSRDLLAMKEGDFMSWLNTNMSGKANSGYDAWNNYRHQLQSGI